MRGRATSRTNPVSRRAVLRAGAGAGVLAIGAGVVSGCGQLPRFGGTDQNGVSLLAGFNSRIIARGGEVVPGTGHVYRNLPDGAATFVDVVGGGWYLAVNHELDGVGGVTSIRFDPDGSITGARSICDGTTWNCAGGSTPWGTWLSGEEWDGGFIWECDPTGARPAAARTALGTFKHEAATVANDGRVYLSEDRSDGGLYRFTPTAPGDLSAGLLEVATGTAPGGTATSAVTWKRVPDPNPGVTAAQTRQQVPGTIRFNGGEGIDSHAGKVLLTTKGDNRIWQYDLASSALSIRYQGGPPTGLSGVDNLWVDDGSGCLLVAEDGGDMQLVAIRPDDTATVLAQLPGQEQSEITGPCFSPDGQRLYFSSQRAPGGGGHRVGVTYEISGPFDTLLRR